MSRTGATASPVTDKPNIAGNKAMPRKPNWVTARSRICAAVGSSGFTIAYPVRRPAAAMPCLTGFKITRQGMNGDHPGNAVTVHFRNPAPADIGRVFRRQVPPKPAGNFRLTNRRLVRAVFPGLRESCARK